MIIRMSEEVPRYRIDNGSKTNCIARAVRICHWESKPTKSDYKVNTVISNTQLEQWDQEIYNLYKGEVEVFTDGSMRFNNSVITRVLTPPESLRQPIYAQGGILFHFGSNSVLNNHA